MNLGLILCVVGLAQAFVSGIVLVIAGRAVAKDWKSPRKILR